MAKFLTDDGVELFIMLIEHFERRLDFLEAQYKASKFLREWYGDVAFEECP